MTSQHNPAPITADVSATYHSAPVMRVSTPEPAVTVFEPFKPAIPLRPMLTDSETDQLCSLVEKACEDLVDEIWFEEQHTRRGHLAVSFSLDCQVLTGDTCADGDGGYEQVTSDFRDTVTVQIHAWMDLSDIARAVSSEVRGIDCILTR